MHPLFERDRAKKDYRKVEVILRMSFSGQVKRELAALGKMPRHCALAELTGFLYFGADSRSGQIRFRTESLAAAGRVGELTERLLRFRPEVRLRLSRHGRRIYDSYVIRQHRLLLDICGYQPQPEFAFKQSCCKRAFLRGAFLAAGSVSSPEKTYHLEFMTKNTALAEQLIVLMQEFEIDAKIIRRKNLPVVYLKEGEQIVRLLNVMSAHLALMELENLRIVKDMRNSVNRIVNCETANLNKTAQAAWQQAAAIDFIEETVGLNFLNEVLQEIAILRKANMEASLKELGEMLSPPIGRSGVNHRLQRIMEIAEDIKERRENLKHDEEDDRN